MDLHEKQQFGFFLQTATERYVARLEERFRGADAAIAAIHSNDNVYRDMLTQFVDAVFEDFLLNNAGGASFILQALAKRKLNTSDSNETTKFPKDADTVETLLVLMAKRVFTELLQLKTIESLEQHTGYQSV